MASIETLGHDVQAKVNDDWREWYINYSGLTKLLLEAERSAMVGSGDMSQMINPSFRASRKSSSRFTLSSRVASTTDIASSRLRSIMDMIQEKLFGVRASVLAVPSSVRVR